MKQSEAHERAQDARKAVGDLEVQGKADKEQLKEMSAAAGDKMKRIHRDMPKLVELISRNAAQCVQRFPNFALHHRS